jgi:23S rRNA (pseudouridine1915-N3)-methyltransferase
VGEYLYNHLQVHENNSFPLNSFRLWFSSLWKSVGCIFFYELWNLEVFYFSFKKRHTERMKITLAAVAPRRNRTKSEATERLLADYIERAARYLPCDSQLFDSEADVLDWLERQSGRSPAYAILLDSRGQQYTSEEFAAHLGRIRDEGTQRLVLAIGPADGWSAAARQRANLLFSLGRITLPHQLARVVLAEQVYRALTILAGHPYHSGH